MYCVIFRSCTKTGRFVWSYLRSCFVFLSASSPLRSLVRTAVHDWLIECFWFFCMANLPLSFSFRLVFGFYCVSDTKRRRNVYGASRVLSGMSLFFSKLILVYLLYYFFSKWMNVCDSICACPFLSWTKVLSTTLQPRTSMYMYIFK